MINIRPFSEARSNRKSKNNKLFDTSFNNFKHYIEKSTQRKGFNSTSKTFFKLQTSPTKPEIKIQKLNFNQTSSRAFLPPKSITSKQRLSVNTTGRGFIKNTTQYEKFIPQTPSNNQLSRRKQMSQLQLNEKQLKNKIENTAMQRFKELFKKQTNIKSKRIEEEQSKKLINLLNSTYKKKLERVEHQENLNSKKWFNQNDCEAGEGLNKGSTAILMNKNQYEYVSKNEEKNNTLQASKKTLQSKNQLKQSNTEISQKVKSKKQEFVLKDNLKKSIQQKLTKNQQVYDKIKIDESSLNRNKQKTKEESIRIEESLQSERSQFMQKNENKVQKSGYNKEITVKKDQIQKDKVSYQTKQKQTKTEPFSRKFSFKQQATQKQIIQPNISKNEIALKLNKNLGKNQELKQQKKEEQKIVKKQVNENFDQEQESQKQDKRFDAQPLYDVSDLPSAKIVEKNSNHQQKNEKIVSKSGNSIVSQKLTTQNNLKSNVKTSKQIKGSKQLKPKVPTRYQQTDFIQDELQEIVIKKQTKQHPSQKSNKPVQKVQKYQKLQKQINKQKQQIPKLSPRKTKQDLSKRQSKQKQKQKTFNPARQSLTSLSQSIKNNTHSTPLKSHSKNNSSHQQKNMKTSLQNRNQNVQQQEQSKQPQLIDSRQRFDQDFDDEENDAVQQLFYLIGLLQNLGGYNNNSKQFYSNADSSMVEIVMNHRLAAYFISQQFYHYIYVFLRFLERKQKGNFYTLTEEQLIETLEDEEVKESIVQLKQSYQMTPKLLKYTYQKSKMYLTKDDKTYKQDSKAEYHAKCIKHLKQQFKYLYKMYQKTQTSTLGQRLCYLIQIYNILVSLKGEQIKEFEELEEIGEKNYAKHIAQYKSFLIG